MSHEPKCITREEARFLFLRQLIANADYWQNESRTPEIKGKCEGTIFSCLVTLDGGSVGTPGYEVIIHPEDVAGSLHEHIGAYSKGEYCEEESARHAFLLKMIEVESKPRFCRDTLREFIAVLDGFNHIYYPNSETDISRPKIIPCTHPDDKDYAINEGYDYYPGEYDDEKYDIGGNLGEEVLLHFKGKAWPEGLLVSQ